MKLKRLTILSLLTAFSLITFIIEAQIPPLTSVPGIKIGLANIFTLFALRFFKRREVAVMLFVRIFLGSVFSGNISALLYSLSGGFVCFIIESLIINKFSDKNIWALSVLGAIAHNITQICVAALVLSSISVFWYLPALIIAAILSGTFTGLCIQAVILNFGKTLKKHFL